MSTTSTVKVGVRIRPLLSKERSQSASQTLTVIDGSSLSFKGQQFTFDHVFGSNILQNSMYSETAAPMLKSFIEGYNVTIMAYGQTGSGKTYTMGTSTEESDEYKGLIPRFVSDLFENLCAPGDGEDGDGNKAENTVTISFLEIYGEDVYDLLATEGDKYTNNITAERVSMPVREDEKGGVFVQGLFSKAVGSAREALDLMNEGARNRITASTNMNSGSSRSHAVFTVTLEQLVRSSGEEDAVHQMKSKLTFVDLAGSERIKRTGAEGQRMKEGIQINSGLFNLGQVINALADDQRIKQGLKPQHVPYRNSKLTHLLKDALGGNSQTLFLACVSPSESNESETYSTLCYARQARNIQNKPVINMDQTALEIRRLKYAVKTWMLKACGQKFQDLVESGKRKSFGEHLQSLLMSPSSAMSPTKEAECTSFLKRPEVHSYVEAVNRAINEKVCSDNPTPRKVRLSVGLGLSPLRPMGTGSAGVAGGVRKLTYNSHDEKPVGAAGGCAGVASWGDELAAQGLSPATAAHSHRQSVINSMVHCSVEVLEQEDPEETEALVQRMLEMVNKEKEQYAHETQELQKEEQDEQILEVEREIGEKEAILNKLMGTVKSYSAMKADFEKLLDEIGTLDKERQNLERELELAKKADKQHGGGDKQQGAAANSAAVERIRERYVKVKKELEQMRIERTKKENAYRLMQKESKQCTSLEHEIKKLKESKNGMVKAQRAALVQFQKKEKEHLQKIGGMKKSDVKRQQQMNTLKSEIVKKDRVLGHKDREIGRINSKLRACEEHIAQLLRIQNRNRARLTHATANKGAAVEEGKGGGSQLSASEVEHLQSSKSMLDNLVADRVEKRLIKSQYELKSSALQELNREMVAEACEMKVLLSSAKAAADARVEKSGAGSVPTEEEEEYSQQIRICEANIDRITRELDIYNADLDDLSERMDPTLFAPTRRGGGSKGSAGAGKDKGLKEGWEGLGKEIIAGFSVAQFRVLLWDVVGEKADALEEMKRVKEENKALRDTNETLSEKLHDANQTLVQTRSDSKLKLEAAEKQRVQDVWDVVNARETGANESNAAAKVAIQRAQDLEREMEVLLAKEVDHEAAHRRLADEVGSLRKQLDEAQLRLGMAVVEFDDVKVGSAKGKEGLSGNALANTEKFEQMESLWALIGVPSDAKKQMIVDLQNASCVMHDKLLQEMQDDLAECNKDIREYEADLEVCLAVLGRHEEAAALLAKKHPNVRARLTELREVSEQLEKDFALPSARLAKTKEHLLDLVSEMWLDTNDLAAGLQPLIKVMVADTSVAELARRLDTLGLSLVENSFEQWDAELRSLNVTRAQTTNSLIFVRDKSLALGNELEILEERQLRAAVAEAPFMADLSEQAIDGAIELLVGRSASNPQGSAHLLKSSEMLLLHMESIDSTRKQVAASVLAFIRAFKEGTLQDPPPPVNPQESYSHAELQAIVQAAFDISLEAENMVPGLKEELQSVLGEIDCGGHGEDNRRETRMARIDALVEQTKRLSSPHGGSSHLMIMSDAVERHLRPLADKTEEGWVRVMLEKWFKDFVCTEEEVDGYECVRQALMLSRELSRLKEVRNAHRELIQLDNTLSSHVKEMEDFEECSKQDRAKVLKGNSTALLAEEKYRRNGKKKYSVITEKILAAGEALQTLLGAGGGGNASPSSSAVGTPASSSAPAAQEASQGYLAVSIDLSALSARGKDFLTGKKVFQRDFSELMHLHTTNIGGGRRWSGHDGSGSEHDKENSPGAGVLMPPQAPAADELPDVAVKPTTSTGAGILARPLSSRGRNTASSKLVSALPKPAPVTASTRTSARNNFKSADYVSGNQ